VALWIFTALLTSSTPVSRPEAHQRPEDSERVHNPATVQSRLELFIGTEFYHGAPLRLRQRSKEAIFIPQNLFALLSV
jgi:hypothetical protein